MLRPMSARCNKFRRRFFSSIARSFQGPSMDTKPKVKIGIIGSQFQADIHATSLQIMPHEAELVAVASPTPGNAEHFAKRFNIPRAYTD
jgi:hypothetical protein